MQKVEVLVSAMLTGERFKLEMTALLILEANGKRVAVEIPAGVVKVVAGPRDGDRMIDVRWEGRMPVMLFAIDLERRGTEVSEQRGALALNPVDSRKVNYLVAGPGRIIAP